MKTKGIIPRSWRFIKRLLLFLFIWQFFYIIVLKWIDPPLTITQIGNWFGGYGMKRDYVDYTEISRHAKLAVIASEDQKFPVHSGFDWKQIEKALDHNERRPNKIRGGSTISQQTAKNVFLWQGRSWIRKAMETYFTFMIEKIWGKRRILEVYLNVIEMGPGVFGIEAAAQSYYKKSAESLNRSEASRIAACLPNPKKFCVKPATPYVTARGLAIMRNMSNLSTDAGIKSVID
ncbi:monofunctional biosynthetic peptidoglycan transglycosylase [Flavihumibacter sp. ZG627]|uniref:monofunctional biosynthetic peptidoglycan transglycosylase n=1 Tax=Flavihumibacter sp. ZG627 TaxID=1463156 RepID=UPI0009E469FA|nr:monofunctional biosynthetic peptidoglycan transglycosylase [Flavihumibacter sp. ZG627]